jgi:hypothetical protein
LLLLFFMSLICSLYLVLNGRPMYFIGQLVHFISYTPFLSYLSVCVYGFNMFCMVFFDFKVTSVENTEKCFKTLTSRTKDGDEKWKWNIRQWVLQVMFPPACSFILLLFTTHYDARIVSTHSSLAPGLPILLRSWTLPVSRKRRCLLNCAVISLSLGDWFYLKKPSHTKRAFLHSRHFTNSWQKRTDGCLFHLSA